MERPRGVVPGSCLWSACGQRVTLPALRHEVHTWSRFGVPFTTARTRWMLGSKRRRVAFLDHGRLLPKDGFLAQMSQTAATVLLLEVDVRGVARLRATWKDYPRHRNSPKSRSVTGFR